MQHKLLNFLGNRLKRRLIDNNQTNNLISKSAYGHVHDLIMVTNELRYYEDLLSTLGLRFHTIFESFSSSRDGIALRHDCDWSIENALAMAHVEYKANISSTYFLLHPDGFVQKENYFGVVDNKTLKIKSSLLEIAAQLVDMGHEVALHNDLISLALFTKTPPHQFLEQITEAFESAKLHLKGSVAHGSRLCREHGYINYQIFQECESGKVGEEFNKPFVKFDGFSFDKYSLRMKDFGLEYEANFIPHDIYVSDSHGALSISNKKQNKKIDLDKNKSKDVVLETLIQSISSKDKSDIVQCLIHPCHWSPIFNFNQHAFAEIYKRRNINSMNKFVSSLNKKPNILYVKSNISFKSYDESYAKSSNHFVIASSLKVFTQNFLNLNAGRFRNILEVGSGQGEYLNFVKTLCEKDLNDFKTNALGIDGSISGIQLAAKCYPEIYWVADSIEDFLEAAHLELEKLPWLNDINLVLDKTGATFIKTYEGANNFFDSLLSLMSPEGCYVYIASRNFYENNLRKKIYHEWPIDWMGIAENKFGRIEIFDDDFEELKGYYKRVFWVS